jgi:hypothetical protein
MKNAILEEKRRAMDGQISGFFGWRPRKIAAAASSCRPRSALGRPRAVNFRSSTAREERHGPQAGHREGRREGRRARGCARRDGCAAPLPDTPPLPSRRRAAALRAANPNRHARAGADARAAAAACALTALPREPPDGGGAAEQPASFSAMLEAPADGLDLGAPAAHDGDDGEGARARTRTAHSCGGARVRRAVAASHNAQTRTHARAFLWRMRPRGF